MCYPLESRGRAGCGRSPKKLHLETRAIDRGKRIEGFISHFFYFFLVTSGAQKSGVPTEVLSTSLSWECRDLLVPKSVILAPMWDVTCWASKVSAVLGWVNFRA